MNVFRRRHRTLATSICIAGLATLVGCVKVTNGRYDVAGRDVNAIVGANGSGRPAQIGLTRIAEARQRLGDPDAEFHQREGATDVYAARVGYRWSFRPWPVVYVYQAGFRDAPILLRLDYDADGTLRRSSVRPLQGSAARQSLSSDACALWPDLRQPALDFAE